MEWPKKKQKQERKADIINKKLKKEFNVIFGFPRLDTCAQCNIYKQQLNEKSLSEEELSILTAQRELRLRKADAFFDLKRGYKAKAEPGEIECLMFDFMQNLPFPHIPSNPAFYAFYVSKLFDSILYMFPVRGHSYLPNDQDFSLRKKKKRRMERVEVPEE
ncbi:hypothetical protein ILUMI_14434 [Ignelater luminosus]|uniref:Uncharacterized protein n=1 Tax=Ignelater luminosus TaxID=2038154 RepID=A0A8K0CSG8_IGNLU|nr:hypothetical protein ILUMI_14434 [Ignelater luminosus]